MEKQNQTAFQLPRQYRRADKGSIARAIGAKADIGEIHEYTTCTFPAKVEGRLGVRRIRDGNFTAALGVPALDGRGIDGDGAHTEWEHGLISSIEPRTLLMRGLLETLT
jgi:hypothetical protein